MKTIGLAVIAASCGLAKGQSATWVVDISGYSTWGFQGDPINDILEVHLGTWASVTNIQWDVNLTTIGASWADEATIGFVGFDEAINPGIGDSFTVSNTNYTGSQGSAIMLGTDGILRIEFYEIGFDDNPGSIDSIFEAGSTLTLHGSGELPTPGTLAAIGLGGLLVSRRRR